MPHDALDRFASLVRKELAAESVRVLETGSGEAQAENVLYAKLSDGRSLEVVFASSVRDKSALERRLSILTTTFAQSLEHGVRSARPSPARSLKEELRALATRARAADAAVIDAHSPVVWGAASTDARDTPRPPEIELLDVSISTLTVAGSAKIAGPTADSSGRLPDPAVSQVALSDEPEGPVPNALMDRAIERVRELPGLDGLRKGGHVARTMREPGLGVVVRSFASIYLLVLAFDGAFDELRAERAVEESLARIERLVLALPPLDPKPAPMAGVISIRKGRRR